MINEVDMLYLTNM